MAFDSQIIQWATVADFAAYLASVPRPSWCVSATNHNTYIPNERTWRGLASMTSMRKVYIDKGWTSGPHLYLAAEAPNPADTGIWQMTPLAHQGIHAGACNAKRLGLENVGDFDARPPTAAQWNLMLDVNEAICRAWDIEPATVNVHNECMPGRVCPGRYFDANKMRADLAARFAVSRFFTFPGLRVYKSSMLTGEVAAYLPKDARIEIDVINGDGYAMYAGHVKRATWGHDQVLIEPGFIDVRLVQP